MNKSMWNNEAVKAYESGQGVVLVEKPYPHYEPKDVGWTQERLAGMARLKEQQDSRLEPQRTWVGLTDKEIEEIWKIAMFTDYGIGAELSNQPFVHYAKAIEAKLKERNS